MPATDYSKWDAIDKTIPDDEEDMARVRLKEQKASMSNEEVRRLHECWEKPEFKTMFNEYAEEVSDPKHRAESEAYLAQCEAEQRAERDAKEGYLNGRSASEFDSLKDTVPGAPDAPEGSQLLKPHKGFVVKTWQKAPGKSDFDRETGKLFINVCSHDEIDKPTAQDVTAPDGRQGQTWSMPHLCSPAIKDEKDKAGHKCAVVDIVFNTEVLKRMETPNGYGDKWKEMVAKTALDMVGKLHSLQLDHEGHKVLNMKYFGDTGEGPSTLAWKPKEAFDENRPAKPKKASKAAAAAPPAEKAAKVATPEIAAAAQATTNKMAAAASAAKDAPPAKAAPADVAAAAAAATAKAAAKAAKAHKRAPKYSIVHRGVGDLAGAWNDTKLSTSGRPRELCVRVELDDLSSAAEIDLDITERHFELKHEGAGYALSLPLPYSVLSDQGSAKFDKAKHVLTVTLPVAAAAAPMPTWEPKELGQTDEERAAEEAAEKAAEVEARAAAEAVEAAKKEAEKAAREARLKAEEEERNARRQAAIVQAEREAARRADKAANPTPKPSKPKPPKPAPPPAAAPPAADKGDEKEGEWVEVSDAELAAAKAASPAKERPSPAPNAFKAAAEQAATEATQPPLVEADTPAAPTGKGGLPALSNGLLFELD